MIEAAIPHDEEERLQRLYELEILDTIEEQAYDDLTKLASQICQTPISLVSLIDRDRQWFKSHHGLDTRETPRALAFCSHAILEDDVFVVEDSSKDKRFFDNPLAISDPHVRFYAGAPLITNNKKKLGTLCVIGTEPRSITDIQKKALQSLARQVVSQFELRLKIKQLNISMNETKQANKAKSAFLSSMNHQLLTPLNAILGFAQLMKLDKDILTDNHIESVDYIIEEGKNLQLLLKEILDIAKIGSKENDIHIKPIILPKAINQCLLIINKFVKGSNIKIIFHDTDNHIVNADPVLLEQILHNFLSNAVKFNRPNGTVTITSQVQKNNRLRINIKDTGYGLNENQISRLFKPFERITTPPSILTSSGIGLVICKELAELMNATVGVSSVVDEGSTFWLELEQAQ